MEDFIITRGSANVKNAEKLHILTTYKAHKSLKTVNEQEKTENFSNKFKKQCNNTTDEEVHDKKMNEKKNQEIEMKRYRYDVIKFGMSGLDKYNAKQAKIALAISLGAKPPKNKRRNYKKLKEKNKRDILSQIKKEKFSSGLKSSTSIKKYKKKVKSNSHKKNKKSNGILEVYGKVKKK